MYVVCCKRKSSTFQIPAWIKGLLQMNPPNCKKRYCSSKKVESDLPVTNNSMILIRLNFLGPLHNGLFSLEKLLQLEIAVLLGGSCILKIFLFFRTWGLFPYLSDQTFTEGSLFPKPKPNHHYALTTHLATPTRWLCFC